MPIFFSCAPNRKQGVPFSMRKASIRVHGREGQVALRHRRVRDPDLRPVQAVGGDVRRRRIRLELATLAVEPDGTRPHRRDVAAGGRLGQAERAEGLAGEHRRQPSGVLLGVAERDDRVLRQDVDREHHRARHVGRAELLHDERPAEVAEARPAHRLGQRCRGQPELAHPPEDLRLVPLRLVALDRGRRQLPLGELPRGVAEQPLLGGESARAAGRRLGHRGHDPASRSAGGG
jgi:hypothetical protein